MIGKILPLYVLAKEIPPEEKTEKGIIINLAAVKLPTITAEVVAVGGSSKHDEMVIEVGDKILFSPNVFRKFVHPLEKTEYLLLHQKDVLLIW